MRSFIGEENGGLTMKTFSYGCEACGYSRLTENCKTSCGAPYLRFFMTTCVSRMATNKVAPHVFMKIVEHVFGENFLGVPELYNRYKESGFDDPRDFLNVITKPFVEGREVLCLR